MVKRWLIFLATGFAAFIPTAAALCQDVPLLADFGRARLDSSVSPNAACGSSGGDFAFQAVLGREQFAHSVDWVTANCSYAGAGTATLKTPGQHGTVRISTELRVTETFNTPVSVTAVYYTWTDVRAQTGLRQDSFVIHFISPSGSTVVDSTFTATLNSSDPDKSLGNCICQPGAVPAGDPISIGTGNSYDIVSDYATTGPNELGFIRYYNSAPSPATFAMSLGSRWRSNFDRYLRIASSTSVSAQRADGRAVAFTLTGGTWSSDSDIDMRLAQSGSVWKLTDAGDNLETYSAVSATQGRLTSIQTRNGYTQNLVYNSSGQLVSVADSYNRTLSFSYQNGLLQQLATPDGLTFTYSYSSSGAVAGVLDRLASVTYSTAPQTKVSYVYENFNFPLALTGIIDENGARYATWTYDVQGRGLTTERAGGADKITIVYNDNDNSRTVTNALGEQEIYKFTVLQNVSKITEIDRVANGSVSAAKRLFTYDGNGYRASQTDWNGNLTIYINDSHGRPTTIQEASGTPLSRTTTITYDATFHLPSQIVAPGLTTDFSYDGSGNLITLTTTDTTVATSPYSTNGTQRKWTLTWSNFLPVSLQGPRTDIKALTQFDYDASGALTAITNVLGQITKITQHSPGGLPQTNVDPNGVTTQLTYDARLRLSSRTISTTAGPLATKYSHDAAGNLTGTTLPDGSALSNSYDAAHRLTAITDLFNQKIAYTLDPLGNRTQVATLDLNGRQKFKHTAAFDALGRAMQDTGGAGQVTSYAYDNNGNPLTVTDPLKRATAQAFDALDRLVKVTDPIKGIVSTVFDAQDRAVSVADANGVTTKFVYDGFGDIIQETSPAAGTSVYRYDAAGNLTQRTDARGAVANYTYDALDRPLAVTYPANAAENVAYTFDETGHGFGVGRLTSVTDAAGALSRSYDERGNVTAETRSRAGATLLTSYTYDPASRVASITYSSGTTVAYVRDVMGRTTAVTAKPKGSSTAAAVLSKIAYLPFGGIISQTYGNGVAETRTFDLDYRLASLSTSGSKALQDLTYSYDAADNITSIADGVTAANTQKFVYDELDRLTSATGSYGSLAYTYDANGNRLSETAAAFPALDGLGSISTLTYNQAGRLAKVSAGAQSLSEFTYDAFGRRVAKVGSATAATLFQYDAAGRLIEEADGQGNPVAGYIYVNGRPVAEIPADGKLYFLHGDHLGTPQIATDSAVAQKWIGNYQPFGALTASSQTNAIMQDLRLPGQELDVETGLYHNGFRDYVPGWGRYSQSDPIGLIGGMNAYSYVGGNPVTDWDPLGLLQRDSAGNILKVPGHSGVTLTASNSAFQWTADEVILKADDGTKITAYENARNVKVLKSGLSANKFQFGYNCIGKTFADSRFWIEPEEVKSILSGDGYSITRAPQTDDVAVYYSGTTIKHAGTVVVIDGVIYVVHKPGLEPERVDRAEDAWKKPHYLFYYTKRRTE